MELGTAAPDPTLPAWGAALMARVRGRALSHDYQKTALPNGLRVVTAYRQAYSVAISIYVGAGSRYERDEEAGISHFVEHLCFKGTEKHPTPRHVAEVVDVVGGDVNGATDRELTVFYAKVARDDFPTALDLLLDLISSPLFDPQEVEREREVVLEELASIEDSPSQLVGVLVEAALWPGNPLGRDVAGTRQSVQAITRDQALAYQRRQYVPNNMVIAVAGAVDHQEVVDAIWQRAGRWPAGAPATWIPVSNGTGPKVTVRYKDTEQAHLAVAMRGFSLLHPQRHVLSLISLALGEGMSSRLFLELRERRGLVYEISSYVHFFLDTGALTIYAGTEPRKAPSVVSIIMEELERLRQEGLREEELARAHKLARSRILLRLEDTRNVAGWLGGQELLLGRIRTPEEVLQEIEQVTAEDIKRVAQELLQPQAACLAAVGPLPSDGPLASALGA